MNALDAYRYATQRWRQANHDRDQAARARPAAPADMHREGLDAQTIAPRVHLPPTRARQLIDKHEGNTP